MLMTLSEAVRGGAIREDIRGLCPVIDEFEIIANNSKEWNMDQMNAVEFIAFANLISGIID